MAMPDVASRVTRERNDNAGDQSRVRLHGIFPAALVVCRPDLRAHQDQLAGSQVFIDVEAAAAKHLKARQMQMNGMGVVGQVEELYLHAELQRMVARASIDGWLQLT